MEGGMTKRVIVVCGNKHHGKDELAGFLKEQLPDSEIRAYADPLKEAVAIILGVPLEWMYDQDKKESVIRYGHTLRHWLQWFGTEIVRDQVDERAWTHRMGDHVLQSGCTTVIVPDGRFVNESIALRAYLKADAQIVTVRVLRPGYPVDLTHRSESEVANMPDSDFDHVVINDGSLEDLRARANRLVGKILGRLLP